jgi:hypothetical protein
VIPTVERASASSSRGISTVFNYPDFADYRASNQVFGGLRFYSELLERVKILRGVEAVSLGAQIPLGSGISSTLNVRGYVPKPGEDMSSDFNIIGPDYFRTMKIPLLHGREFGQSETAAAPQVVIINETAARRFWPDEIPVGRRLILGRAPDEEYREIVGVVKDSKYRRLTDEVRPAMYVPLAQDYRANIWCG